MGWAKGVARKPNRIELTGDTAKIFLSSGHIATIDAEDVERVRPYSWHAVFAKNGVYACSKTGGKATYLHRLIAETPDGLDTDHRDGDGLNNRRRNLRPATESQNLLNVGPRKGKRFKGIFARPSGFVVRAPLANGKQKYLGTVKTAEQAAMIYDSYVAENCSEFARKNF
jgi:hypothetical protein